MGKKKKKKEEVQKTAIDKLAELIPRINIDFYLDIYREMINVTFKKSNTDYPSKLVFGIKKRIGKLQMLGWLDKNNAEGITEFFDGCMFLSNTGRNMDKMIGKMHMLKRGAPKDYALAFLIMAIVFDLRHYPPKKPQFNLVLEFLRQQKILPINSALEVAELRKRDRKLNIVEVTKSFLYASFLSDNIYDLYKKLDANYQQLPEGFLRTMFEILDHMSTEGIKQFGSKTLTSLN